MLILSLLISLLINMTIQSQPRAIQANIYCLVLFEWISRWFRMNSVCSCFQGLPYTSQIQGRQPLFGYFLYHTIHIYLSGMWLSVVPRTKYRKDMCCKEIGLHLPNMVPILSSIVNIIGDLLTIHHCITELITWINPTLSHVSYRAILPRYEGSCMVYRPE